MAPFNYLNPILGRLRKGDLNDPYIDITQSVLVPSDSKFQFAELPSEADRVTIPSMVEVIKMPTNGLANNEFYVDYYNGYGYVNSSLGSTTINGVQYKGRGAIYLSAARIWTNEDNGTITQTLDSVVAAASQFVYKGQYNPSTVYSTYNIVRYQNASYMYTAVTSSSGNIPTDTTHWSKIVGLTSMSTYSTSATYSAGDMVSDAANNNVYNSLVDNNTNNPVSDATKWQLMITVTAAVNAANQATTDANNAASNANSAATSANNATTAANNAATSLTHRGNYNASTAYVVNNIVYYSGSTYMCIQNGTGQTPSASSTYWKKLNTENWQGTYSTSTTYMFGDSVVDVSNENVYMSIMDTNTNNPLTDNTKWQLLISATVAITSANAATTSANNATASANTATTSANDAATAANTAKTNADTATSNANTATTNANNATTAANNAATSANSLVTTFVARGAYDPATAYVPNNTVVYSGSSWRCLQNSTGNTPVEGIYWTLVAAKGADGTGTVTSLASSNGEVVIAGTAQIPDLAVNTGTGANKIPKRDSNGNLQNIGNQVIAISANTTLTYGQSGIIAVTTGASNITVTLPSAVTSQVVYIIKKMDNGAGQVIINTTSSQLIDGTSTKTIINQYGFIGVVSDGTGWQVIDNSSSSISSANSDIGVNNNVLTLNTGTGANQIPKRDVNGNIQNIGNQITNISANATLTYAQSGIIMVTTAATPITVTLPTAIGSAQLMYTIKKADSGIGTITIATTSSQTIDGVTTQTLTNQYANITVVSDGSNWVVDIPNNYDKIGILPNLQTTAKDNLVNAINEVKNSSVSYGHYDWSFNALSDSMDLIDKNNGNAVIKRIYNNGDEKVIGQFYEVSVMKAGFDFAKTDTTQTDFATGTLTQVDATTSPGDLILAKNGAVYYTTGNRVTTYNLDSVKIVGTGSAISWNGIGSNLCSGGTATENGHNGTNVAANAFDGSQATYWGSLETAANQNGVSYLGYTFAVARHIRKISIRQYSASGNCITSFLVQYYNGSAWVTVATVNGLPANDAPFLISLPASTAATQWRILANANLANSFGWTVEELQMMEDLSATVTVETSLDNVIFTPLLNGGSPSQLAADTDVKGKTLYLRQTLTTPNTSSTPAINDITINVPSKVG